MARHLDRITRRALGSVLAAPFARATRRPNFLFLLADDHAGYVLGCDGNRLARTPNLDRLASEGTRFAAHYCNSPVCTPSRQSFLTGQLPHAAGVTLLGTPLAADKPTLARQFQDAGYRTAVFGKMHFNQPAAPGLHGFDLTMTEDAIDRAWRDDAAPPDPPANILTKPPWRPFRDPARIWLNGDKRPYPRDDRHMRGTYIGRRAIEYLEENRDRPFALWVSFQEPHSPFDFPIEDRALFRPEQFTVALRGAEDAAQIPNVFRDLTDDDHRGIVAALHVGRIPRPQRGPRPRCAPAPEA